MELTKIVKKTGNEKFIGIVMDVNEEAKEVTVIFANGSEETIKNSVISRRYIEVGKAENANDFSVPEGVDAISREQWVEMQNEGKQADEEDEKKYDGKTPEEVAAEKEAEKQRKKEEADAKKAKLKEEKEAQKAEAKAKKEAEAAQRKADQAAKKAEKEAERAAANAPLTPYPVTYRGSEDASTEKRPAATTHDFEFEKDGERIFLELTVHNGTSGIKPVKRGNHVYKFVTVPPTEEGAEESVQPQTLMKCTSISKALIEFIGVSESEVNRAKKTIANFIHTGTATGIVEEAAATSEDEKPALDVDAEGNVTEQTQDAPPAE